MSLDFSALHLVIGEESPSAEGLKPAFSGGEDKYTNKDTRCLISKENLDDKYFWLCARYGKSLPYSPTVYNIELTQSLCHCERSEAIQKCRHWKDWIATPPSEARNCVRKFYNSQLILGQICIKDAEKMVEGFL
jgi:hypothetical protein